MAADERVPLAELVGFVDAHAEPLVRALSPAVDVALDDGHAVADGRGERDALGDRVSLALRLRDTVKTDDAVAPSTVAEANADPDAVRVAIDDAL